MKMLSIGRGLRFGIERKRKRYADDDDAATVRRRRLRDERRRKKSIGKEAEEEAEAEAEAAAATGDIKKGDVVDIKDLLFTKDRDYLINHNNQRVQHTDLVGKVIVMYFMNLIPLDNLWMQHHTTCLVDIYNELHPKGCLEVVFVALTDDATAHGINNKQKLYSTSEEQRFQERYSLFPWAAIPFSDVESRKRLEILFGGIPSDFRNSTYPNSFIIDPTGLVLQCLHAGHYIFDFGAPGYPYSDERINFLISEDDAIRDKPTMTKLLTSPERNYLISSTGEKVPVSDLEDKVVALYFYEERSKDEESSDDEDHEDGLLQDIQTAYRELTKNEKNFEIVLIYAHDTIESFDCTSEMTFWKRFRAMPWLALPFKDQNYKRMQRIFENPHMRAELGYYDPTLVIIGPHGSFTEQYGADILSTFGVAAYPFTRVSAVNSEAEKAKRLKLDMFWRNPDELFRQIDGPDVRFSQIVGKRTILLFGDKYSAGFYRMLKARYLQMKGTIDEFEVIHIFGAQPGSPFNFHDVESSYPKELPWLTHPYFGWESYEGKLLRSVLYVSSGLLAFDRDGRLVVRTISPKFTKENMDFPFHGTSLEKDSMIQLLETFQWWNWN